MSITKPLLKLYASNGTTLLYTFPLVQSTNIPQSPVNTVVLESQRAKGSLVIYGGEASWDIDIEGLFMIDNDDEGYEEITAKIDAIESAIQVNTPYILRFDRTASTYYEYKVKRINAIEYPESLRTDIQTYRINLLTNCW